MTTIINLLKETIILLVLVNIVIVFIPKSIKKVIVNTSKIIFKITKCMCTLLKPVVINLSNNIIASNLDEDNKDKKCLSTKNKKKSTSSKTSINNGKTKVIKFPIQQSK